MKQIFLLLLTAGTALIYSCRKENIPFEENLVSSARNSNNEMSVPFKGDFITTHELLQGPAVQRITGKGNATHMGKTLFVANATLNFTTPPPFAIAGTAVYTAADGSQFYTQFTGTSTPTGNGTSRGIINHTITGGKGRFKHVSGNFTGIALVDAASPVSTVSFDGHISY